MSSLYGEWIITLDMENSGTFNEKVRRPLQMPKMRRFLQWKQEIKKKNQNASKTRPNLRSALSRIWRNYYFVYFVQGFSID